MEGVGSAPATLSLLAIVVSLATSGCRIGSAPTAPPAASTAALLASLQTALPGATVALLIAEADTGRELVSVNPDTLLVPASNTKLFTTAAALEMLGPTYRYATELRAVDVTETGKVDIVLIGGGDPTLGDPSGICIDALLSEIAEAVREAGICERINDLVVDDSWLGADRYCRDWLLGDVDFAYAAPVSAASLNDNLLVIHMQATQDGVAVTSDLPYEIDSGVRVAEGTNITVNRIKPGEPVTIRGTISPGPGVDLYVPADDPPLFWAGRLADGLESRGIHILGLPRAGPAGPGTSLRTWLSPSIAEIVRETNKSSRNLWADLLFQTLGKEIVGDGTFGGGAEAVALFLERSGVRSGETSIVDGSGLARTNLTTARAIMRVLLSMRRSPRRAEFEFSLPVAGIDGTIRRRFAGTLLEGRLAAKTGTLRHVNVLSGYMRGSRDLAFVMIVNGRLGAARDATAAIDGFLVGIALMIDPGMGATGRR
ncbi:MAG: D-alanyl-D-alanine carboxypeptidase/D-alanyl-D-alanine-endopeptidase [Acidobacteria bacterium]|nr:D-alanyl-D-alanine carboxypeptidase/D-alanyl-D-alanine-endopeptidase [Acidobacteriota bacterium]